MRTRDIQYALRRTAPANATQHQPSTATSVIWTVLACALFGSGCAGGPQIGYESAPDAMQEGDAADTTEAQALEQAEADCARQGKHAEAKRVEGETVYDCTSQ